MRSCPCGVENRFDHHNSSECLRSHEGIPGCFPDGIPGVLEFYVVNDSPDLSTIDGIRCLDDTITSCIIPALAQHQRDSNGTKAGAISSGNAGTYVDGE